MKNLGLLKTGPPPFKCLFPAQPNSHFRLATCNLLQYPLHNFPWGISPTHIFAKCPAYHRSFWSFIILKISGSLDRAVLPIAFRPLGSTKPLPFKYPLIHLFPHILRFVAVQAFGTAVLTVLPLLIYSYLWTTQ